MSRLLGILGRTTGACLAVALAGMLLAGCGKGRTEEKPSGKTAETAMEAQLRKERERELVLKQKLDALKMPEQLAREWFYDGDATYDLGVEWQADGSRVRLELRRWMAKGTPSKGGSGPKPVVGFYVSDFPRGPYKYLARMLDWELILPKPMPLKEVQHAWYRAVVFDDAGKPTHLTDPVQASIVDHNPKAATPGEKKVPAPKAATEKKAPEPKGTAPAEKKVPDSKATEAAGAKTGAKPESAVAPPPVPAVKTRVIAVAPLTNATEKDPLDRDYLGRGIAEVLRGFLPDLPGVDCPDPAYVDAVLGRQRAPQRQLTSNTLSTIATAVGAEAMVGGSFQLTDQGLRVDLFIVNAETGAATMAQPVTFANDAPDDMAKGVAAELSHLLRVDFAPEKTAKFSTTWKTLNDRRRSIEQAMTLRKQEKNTEAVAAFESIPKGEVRDPEALLAISESYNRLGKPLEAARLAALASHAPNWKPPQSYVESLGRILGNAHDFRGSLEVLADVRMNPFDPVWQEGMKLLEQSLAAKVGDRAWKGPERKWPTVPPVWQVTTDTMLTGPCIGDGRLVVVGSAEKDVMNSVFSDPETASHWGSVKTPFANAQLYQTYAYDLATGDLQWQKSKLISGASTPVISGGVLFGMGPAGPVAVSLKNGDVVWDDKAGRVKPPDAVFATGVDFGRPWWKMFELRRTGTGLVVWHPKQDAVYFYNAADGKYNGAAYHNGTWSAAGQFFFQKPDGLYFMKRGGEQLEKLSDDRMADPMALTRDLHLLADPGAVLQGDSLFEVTRQIAAGEAERFDFFVVASDPGKGAFKWVYPLLGNQTPVIADGKLFVYKKSITGKPSMSIQMIDVDKQEAKTIDLSALDVGFYEPTLSLPGGKSILIGSQAAISATDAKVLWVNRNLPVCRSPRLVGKNLLIPPLLVDPATGSVVVELQAVPAIDWQQALFVSTDQHLAVITSGNSPSVRQRSETGAEGIIRVYSTAPVGSPTGGPAAEKPKAVPLPATLSLADLEKAFLDSDLAPPLGAHVYDLFDRLAQATYETTGSASKSVEYLAGVLKMRPRNGKHVLWLLDTTKPYVSMAGEYDRFITLLDDVKKDYSQDTQVVQAATNYAKTAQSEKLESANAAKYFENIKTAKHDPLDDWPSDRPANGAGNRGTGFVPPFNAAWTVKMPKAGSLDRIAITEPAVLVLQDNTHVLTALKPSSGDKMWETPDVRDFVYYRGIVYVVGRELKALTPREGQALWRRRLTADDLSGGLVLAAGQDLIFLGVRQGIEAFDWTNGHDVYRVDLPGKNRLDVHGSVLVASTTQTGMTHAVDAKTGDRLWSGDMGTYSVFDGKLYSLSIFPDSKPPDLLLVAYHVRTGRELWRRHYDLPAVQRKLAVLAPAVTLDEILAVADRNLFQITRQTGDVRAKQSLPTDVTQPMQATPSRVYLSGAMNMLMGFDREKRLSKVWELPTTGREVVAIGDGVLYVLEKEELKAYRGEKENYTAEDLKALAYPNEELPGVTAETLQEVNVRPTPFVGIGSIRDTKELIPKLDDKRLSDLAFYELLNVGQPADWKTMIEESMSVKPPGERKMRPLTAAELRLLYAEMIQRREPAAMELVREAVQSPVPGRSKMVIELMATGDRTTYGPVLIQVFRDALKEKQYGTVISCAQAVGAWGLEPGQPLLVQGLDDDKAPDNVRLGCAQAIGMFDNPAALRALVKVARDDPRPVLSKQCTDLLVQRGEDGIKAVGAILADPSASERGRIDSAEALANAKGREAIPLLLAALNNDRKKYPPKVQGAAASSLGPLSALQPDVLTALAAQMNNAKNDGYLRNACMAAIGSSKIPAVAVPFLIAAMADREVDNRKFTNLSAHQLLIQLTGEKNVGQYPDEWRKWWEKNKDRFQPKP